MMTERLVFGYRKGDIALAFDTAGLPYEERQMIWMVVDPAAGGPQSDYAVVSVVRSKGCVQVRMIDPCIDSACIDSGHGRNQTTRAGRTLDTPARRRRGWWCRW